MSQVRRRLAALLCGICFGANVILSAAPLSRGDLYILTVGVDGQYPDSAHDINAQDAVYVRQALVAGESLYRHVHSRALLGTGGTRTAVLDGLDWLVGATTPDDVAILFFACHGSIKEKGYFISLAKDTHPKSTDVGGLWGHELASAVSRLKGRPVLFVDSCYSGALAPAPTSTRPPAMIVSCEANAVSVGQVERFDRPSGYFVLALCEALSGLADTDLDRIVTLREIGDYLPARAQAFFEGQRAVVIRQPAMDAIALARVNPAWPPQQFLTPQLRRNPFGWPDVPYPDGADVHNFAAKVKLDGAVSDPNAAAWPRKIVSVTDVIDGAWETRWANRKSPGRWVNGIAEVKSVRDRVYILYQHESGVKQVIEAVRIGADRLVGRYFDPVHPKDSTPWVGRIVDNQRIDGEWGEGRWDFRRRFGSPAGQ